jgi:hypothetical protein
MDIKELIDNYYVEHRHDVLLSPYNSLHEFAQMVAEWQKEQMMKDAISFYEILKAVPPGPERDKVKLIIIPDNEK